VRPVGALEVLLAGLGEAQPVTAWGPGDIDGLARLEAFALCPALQDTERAAQLPEAGLGDLFKVGNPPAPPGFGVFLAKPAESDQHIDGRDEPVAP
jgi:hypothetical protein